MARNRNKRKDYSKLLKELQQQSQESDSDNKINSSSTVEGLIELDSDVGHEKPLNVEYDLDALLNSVNDLNDLISLYNLCTEQVEYEQQITQDLLHAIEFSTDYKERCKYATQLHYNRQRRRVYKNVVQTLKPIVEFLQREENVKVVNRLTNILGEARKAKLHSEDRVYSPRILTELGVFSNGSNSNK